jgi:hypothetical protein
LLVDRSGRGIRVFVSFGQSLDVPARAALTLDEFALWLNVEEGVYWTRRDFASLDAIILFGSALLMGIWGGDFLKALARELRHPQPQHRRAR